MEKRENSGSNFLLQGSILAAAGLIVRLIGLLYKIPMTRILGDEGIGYYNTAYEIYNIGLILSSYSLPLAVSKLIAAKEQEGRRADARRVFNCGIAVGVFAGGIMSVLLILGADRIAVSIFNSPGSALPLKVMAPTIFVFAVMRRVFSLISSLLALMSDAFCSIRRELLATACAFSLILPLFSNILPALAATSPLSSFKLPESASIRVLLWLMAAFSSDCRVFTMFSR